MAAFVVCGADAPVGPPLPLVNESDFKSTWRVLLDNDAETDSKAAPKPARPAFLSRKTGPSPTIDLEAVSSIPPGAVYADFASENMLAKAVHVAFYEHYPLRLSPDVIWVTIVQGLARHFAARPQLMVRHMGAYISRRVPVVERRGFVQGSPFNDWPGAFKEVTAQLAGQMQSDDLKLLSRSSFTTSSASDALITQVALLDTAKINFQYTARFGCGIPAVELTGTVADWASLASRAARLTAFDLDWWVQHLVPVLQQFVAAAKGTPDVDFWKSVCNLHGASGLGRAPISGWLQVFFPYLTTGRNPYLGEWRESYDNGTFDDHRFVEADRNEHIRSCLDETRPGDGCGRGVNLADIPTGVSKTAMQFLDLDAKRTYNMTFAGGVVAVVQDPQTFALEPLTGWALARRGEVVGKRLINMLRRK